MEEGRFSEETNLVVDIMEAIGHNEYSRFCRILDERVPPERINEPFLGFKHEDGYTMLHQACTSEATPCVKLLLERGALLYPTGTGDFSPSIYCSLQNDEQLTMLLESCQQHGIRFRSVDMCRYVIAMKFYNAMRILKDFGYVKYGTLPKNVPYATSMVRVIDMGRMLCQHAAYVLCALSRAITKQPMEKNILRHMAKHVWTTRISHAESHWEKKFECIVTKEEGWKINFPY